MDIAKAAAHEKQEPPHGLAVAHQNEPAREEHGAQPLAQDVQKERVGVREQRDLRARPMEDLGNF